jgi:hypothetical protein
VAEKVEPETHGAAGAHASDVAFHVKPTAQLHCVEPAGVLALYPAAALVLQGVQASAPAAAEKVLTGHWEHALFVVPPVVVEHEVAW